MALRRPAAVVLLLLLLLLAGLCVFVWDSRRSGWPPIPATLRRTPPNARPPLRYILVWHLVFDNPILGFQLGEGQTPFQVAGCPVDACYITRSHDHMPPEDYHAVLFHGRDFSAGKKGAFPPARRPSQRYVFFLRESPEYTHSKLQGTENVFNWTMTYRLDSDVPAPYGKVVARAWKGAGAGATGTWARAPDPPKKPGAAGASPKRADPATKSPRRPLVAWLVSHCDTKSKREKYVSALAAHVGVDVFGRCGTRWSGDREAFYRMVVSRPYKFYLSFENSVCSDYVTEKFFSILEHDVVPVVLGGANYSQHAPPYSYIDVKDFESPQHLAEYLMFLDDNPQEYAKYFWWKQRYEATDALLEPLCRLCAMLHEPEPQHAYADLAAWWHGGGACTDPYKWGARAP